MAITRGPGIGRVDSPCQHVPSGLMLGGLAGAQALARKRGRRNDDTRGRRDGHPG